MHLFQFCIFDKSVTFMVINYTLTHRKKSRHSLEHEIAVVFEEGLFEPIYGSNFQFLFTINMTLLF